MIHVKLALPTLGACEMAGLLGQPLECYLFSHEIIGIMGVIGINGMFSENKRIE